MESRSRSCPSFPYSSVFCLLFCHFHVIMRYDTDCPEQCCKKNQCVPHNLPGVVSCPPGGEPYFSVKPFASQFLFVVYCLECSCPTGWDKHTRTDGKTYCYRYFEDLKYWTDARRHCMEFSNVDVNGCKLHQADLASIDSLNTNTYLLGLEKKTPGSRKELCQRNFNQILVL